MVDVVSLAALTLLAGFATSVAAQPLPDPTRPPIGTTAGIAATGAPGAAEEGAGQNVRQLNSVILRPGFKPRALISGEWVELGQKSGDAKVVKISSHRVELRGPQGREVLALNPDVDMRPSAPIPKTKASQRVQP